MLQIDGAVIPKFPVANPRRLRDLIYFDGPLLTEFVCPRGGHYLYYWVDTDGQVNRWMVLRMAEITIARLINHDLKMEDVIPELCEDDFVYFVELDGTGNPSRVILSDIDNIPPEYTPDVGAEIDAHVSLDSEDNRYSIVIGGDWSVDQLAYFPRKYAQAYSLVYALNNTELMKLPEFPWRGGFSSMHFYNWITERLPVDRRPRVVRFQYASPGILSYSLHRTTAEKVAASIIKFMEGGSAQFHLLSDFIRKNKLNDLRQLKTGNEGWERFDPTLRELTHSLVTELGAFDSTRFMNLVPHPFEAAKIAMTYYVRIKAMAEYQSAGLIRLSTAGDMP